MLWHLLDAIAEIAFRNRQSSKKGKFEKAQRRPEYKRPDGNYTDYSTVQITRFTPVCFKTKMIPTLQKVLLVRSQFEQICTSIIRSAVP